MPAPFPLVRFHGVTLLHDAEEDALHGGSTHRVALQRQGLLVVFESLDEVLSVADAAPLAAQGGVGWHNETDLAAQVLALKAGVGKDAQDPVGNGLHLLRRGHGRRLQDEVHVVLVAMGLAQLLRGANGQQPLRDDGRPGGESVGFLHRVRRDEDAAVRGHGLERLPEHALRRRIHGGGL